MQRVRYLLRGHADPEQRSAHLRQHARRESREVQERDVLLRRHVVATVRRHDVARESTGTVAWYAQLDRAHALDAVRARDESVSLVAAFLSSTKEHLDLGRHHSLQDINDSRTHLRHDLAHRELRRLLEPLRQGDDIGDADDDLHQAFIHALRNRHIGLSFFGKPRTQDSLHDHRGHRPETRSDQTRSGRPVRTGSEGSRRSRGKSGQ